MCASSGAARSRNQAKARPFAEPDELGCIWSSAALGDVRTGELHAGASYADFEDLWLPMTAPDGSPGVYFAELEVPHRDALRQEVRRRLGSPVGSFRPTPRAWYVRAHKETGPSRSQAFLMSGSDGTRTRDLRRDRPAL